MTSDLIPADVRQFILDTIGSISELEALLLLRKRADQDWTAQAISERIYLDEAAAAQILARLAARGLLATRDGAYRYSPSTDDLRAIIDRLADTYARYLIPVTSLIHNKHSGIEKFADAFKFRKDK